MSWTTSVIIDPGETHKWRFLGGNRQDDFTMLSLLPEPYLMSGEQVYLDCRISGFGPSGWNHFQQRTWLLKVKELAVAECQSELKGVHEEVRFPNNQP